MANIILINFEGVIDDYERDAIERCIDHPVMAVLNLSPVPPNGTDPETFVLDLIESILRETQELYQPAFLIRLPDALPLFSVLFFVAFDAVVGVAPAILDIRYTDDFPPEISSYSKIVSLQSIRQKAQLMRYEVSHPALS